MKKPLAIILLMLGGFAGIFRLSLVNLTLFFNLQESLSFLTFLLPAFITMGAAYLTDRLRALFAEKYSLSALKFFLCTYALSIAAALVYFILTWNLDVAVHFKGFYPGGFGEVLTGLAWLITAAVTIVFGLIFLAMSSSGKENKL